MWKQSNRKGAEAERYFRKWLDQHHIPYFYISQDLLTPISRGLKEVFNAKRPDFIVLIEKLGLIFVDVKFRDWSDSGSFTINAANVNKYASLQKNFNFKVWLALSNEKVNFRKWYWVNITDIVRNYRPGKVFRNFAGRTKVYLAYSIPVEHHAHINFEDDINDLLRKVIFKK